MNTRQTSAPAWAQTVQRLLGCLTLTLCALGSMLGSAFAEGQTGPLPDATIGATLTAKPGKQSAVFAGGCFWGVEALFLHVKGVLSSTSGYAGGSAATASYPTVSGGNTGHAEAVEVAGGGCGVRAHVFEVELVADLQLRQRAALDDAVDAVARWPE